jgi:hypothetical protein
MLNPLTVWIRWAQETISADGGASQPARTTFKKESSAQQPYRRRANLLKRDHRRAWNTCWHHELALALMAAIGYKTQAQGLHASP